MTYQQRYKNQKKEVKQRYLLQSEEKIVILRTHYSFKVYSNVSSSIFKYFIF